MTMSTITESDILPQRHHGRLFAVCLALMLAGVPVLLAGTIHVPNSSFESPATDFATPEIGAWQKAPQPMWYNDTNFPWAQLTGQFLNTSNGAPDHIDNVEGHQAAFLFALPGVAVFQDYNTFDGTNSM